MNDLAFGVLSTLLRTTLCLAVAAGLALAVLRIFSVRSPRMHRIVWVCVLAQGWLVWKMPLPVLPADIALSQQTATLLLALGTSNEASTSGRQILKGPPPGWSQAHLSPNEASTIQSASPLAPPPAARRKWSAPSLASWIAAGWCAGGVLLAARFALRYARFVQWAAQSRPAEAAWSRQWQSLLDEAGVKAVIPLVVNNAGPMLGRTPGGYRLIVPADLWPTLSDPQQRAILHHELAHYQRGDIGKSLLVRLLMLPHWFNPLAHLAVRRFDECAELACDDAVRRAQPDVAPTYAHALLDLIRRETAAAAFCPGAGGRCMSARIRRLVNASRMEDSVMKRISLFSLVAVFLLAGLFQVTAADQPASQAPAADKATSAAQDAPADAAPVATFKIDVAYVDVSYIFKHLDEFEQKRKSLQKEVGQARAEINALVEKLRAASQEDGGAKAAAMQAEIKSLQQQQTEKFRQQEAQIYDEVFNRLQAETAKYAREHSIRVVRQLKPTAEERENESAALDAKKVMQRINRDVIYQADERVDITQEILSRLNKTAPEGSTTDAP